MKVIDTRRAYAREREREGWMGGRGKGKRGERRHYDVITSARQYVHYVIVDYMTLIARRINNS
jgi:hypothetical protein